MPIPPFSSAQSVQIIMPANLDADDLSLKTIPLIFSENRAALERELGAPFAFADHDPGVGPRWYIGPSSHNKALLESGLFTSAEPALFLDRDQQILVTDGETANDIWETFGLLRSLARFEGGVMPITDCRDVEDAVQRIMDEVGDCYPSFDLLHIDWGALCEQQKPNVMASSAPIVAMQEWLAELQDTHTWVRPVPNPVYLPYEVWVEGDTATFYHVPATSAAWVAGVRPGFRLLDHDPAGWWRRTAATAHARSLVTGRRMLQGEIGQERELAAESPDGRRVTWREVMPAHPWEAEAVWERLPSGAGYLKINSWSNAPVLEAIIDTAFDAFKKSSGLVVDLRGNGGGDLTLAQRFRNRFLHREMKMGSIRYSTAHRQHSKAETILGVPVPMEQRWNGRVRFLTDPLTYSASEDALLGLQGLDHVEVWGQPSGGGSGRVRVLRLLPGWRLTMSTALIYDRSGQCIEGHGVPVDHPVTPEPFTNTDVLLRKAERGW